MKSHVCYIKKIIQTLSCIFPNNNIKNVSRGRLAPAAPREIAPRSADLALLRCRTAISTARDGNGAGPAPTSGILTSPTLRLRIRPLAALHQSRSRWALPSPLK
ncbi:hypothetical protein PAL_GLEAN10005827 [Pteropus alecto]|uniref:Uncharacterized protein n=1 Tax=Pteropus alecto TaxID=9402 RepID=L5K0B3_PTEAL|nr:hypothetical protein PAL_GLEAN10005827 [Pteropus alecto]